MTLKGHGNNLETELICLAPHAAPPVQLWESAFQSLRDTCVLVCVIAIGKQDGHVAEVWGASRHRGILLLLCPGLLHQASTSHCPALAHFWRL